MDAENSDPLALVQPTPFSALCGNLPLTGPDGQQHQFVMLRFDTPTGSFVQLMRVDQVKSLVKMLDQMVDLAEAEASDLITSSSAGKLVLPNGAATGR